MLVLWRRRGQRSVQQISRYVATIRGQFLQHSFVQPHKEKSDLIITNNDRFDENIHVLTDIISKNLELKNEPKI